MSITPQSSMELITTSQTPFLFFFPVSYPERVRVAVPMDPTNTTAINSTPKIMECMPAAAMETLFSMAMR